MRPIRLPALILAVLFTFSPGCGQSAAPAAVTKLGERRLALPTSAAPVQWPVNRPYFDRSGRLEWNGSSSETPGSCPSGAREVQRVTRLLSPRIDEVLCSATAPGGIAVTESALVGVATAGQPRWRRPLGFRSGELRLDERVIGAGPTGVVLSDLTVLSPETGEVLLPPATHPVGAERRPVPDYDLSQSAVYLPKRQAFLTFEADVTLVRRSGGLYLLDPGAKRKDLVRGVATTVTGAYWRVEEMAASPNGQRVILAQKLAARGPGGVSFAVLDLGNQKVVFEERFGEGHYCHSPRLTLGNRGEIGFSYVDDTEGKVVLIHYRVGAAP